MNGRDDQFDKDEPESSYPRAPLPPHERVWRHPAEVGAAQTVTIKPASRQSKTLAFIAATASMATTVVFAQVLRPVERGKDISTTTSAASVAAETALPAAPGVFKIDGISFAAVAISSDSKRKVLISSKDAAVASSTRLEGAQAPLVLAGIDDALGIAIWCTSADIAAASQTSVPSLHASDPVTVWDGGVVNGAIGISTQRDTNSPLVPLDITANVHAGSPVYDALGNLVGIVMIKTHSRWMLPINAVTSRIPAVTTINAIVEALGFAPLHRHDGVEVGLILDTDKFAAGDVITHIGETSVSSLASLAEALRTVAGGRAIFTVLRDGATNQVSVSLP